MDEALFTYLPIKISPRLFILAFFLALGIVFSWRTYLLYKLRCQLKNVEKENKKLQQFLNHSGSAWIYWSLKANTLVSYAIALKTLGLPFHENMKIETLLNWFSIENVPALEKNLAKLRDMGTGFEMTLPLQDKGVILEVKGHNLDNDTRLISLRDVTQEVHKNNYQSSEITELLTERNHFITILNALPFPIWTRSENGKLTFCNMHYARALDSTPEDVVNRGKILWPSFYSGTLQEDLGAQFFLTPHRDHLIIRGARRLMELSEVLCNQEFVGYAHDLTEVEMAQNELKRHIDAHHEVLEGISTGITIYGPDKRLKFFNHAYSRMFEMDENWMHTEPSLGEILEDLRQRQMVSEISDFPAYKQKIYKIFTSLLNPFQQLEHLSDGRTLRMVTAPHPLGGIFYTFEDVTDKLELERQYNTLIEVQQATLGNLYEGVAVFGADYRLKLYNPAFQRIWSLEGETLNQGQHISEVIEKIKKYFDFKEDWEAYKEKITHYVTDRIPKHRTLLRVDGSALELSYVPLPDGAHMMSYIDITDSLKAERALRERNQALQTADKLKSEFIANVTDELRFPLNEIIGNTEILLDRFIGDLNEEQKFYVSRVRTTSENLMILVNDIIDLATLEAGHMKLTFQEVDLYTLLTNLGKILEDPLMKAQIHFKMTCDPDIGCFRIDEKRLKQALYNILVQAIKFTPEKGSIVLQAVKKERTLRITVSDTGEGKGREEPSYSLNSFSHPSINEHSLSKGLGLGLGLPLVKNLVELHGGKLKIRSKAKKGTTVTCIFPLEKFSPVTNDNMNRLENKERIPIVGRGG